MCSERPRQYMFTPVRTKSRYEIIPEYSDKNGRRKGFVRDGGEKSPQKILEYDIV